MLVSRRRPNKFRFLLKYASRDEVDLLGRGNGGIVEIRNAISQYEELSPLFGFLRYRRRNVIIKYVPEDCSRLVQGESLRSSSKTNVACMLTIHKARVTVHFNAVTERFSPHDTVFPISTSKELRDTTLSAACSLHTASGSTSSSTSSLRRRRLMEIAEDAEEDNRAKRQSTVPEERPPTAKAPSITGQAISESSPPPALSIGVTPSTTKHSLISEVPSYESPGSGLRSSSPSRAEDEPRKSSQSTRPDFYSYSSYGSNGKPKVKLGPRPSLDVGGRPHTSSAASHYRPVSTLPAGLKLYSKGSKSTKDRPKSQYPTETPSMTLSPPSAPDSSQVTPVRPHTSGGRPNTSSGASVKPVSSANNTPKLPVMTPEKARLMKAMELRKKQKQMSVVTPAPVEPLCLAASDTLKSPISQANRVSGAPKEVHDTLAMLNEMTKEDDSGIAFDTSSTMKTDESDATRSDSYPVSPVGPSERAESTKASSISESTDETIQEVHNSKLATDEYEKAAGENNQAAVDFVPPDNPAAHTTPTTPTIDDLPQLLPVTYKPPPTTNTSRTYRDADLVVDNSTPIEFSGREEHVELVTDEPKGTATSELPNPDTEDEQVDKQSQQDPSDSFSPITVPDIVSQPPSPAKISIKEWKVPRSKFSVQDLNAAAENPPLPHAATQSSLAPALPSPVGSGFSVDTRSITEDEQENGATSSRRMKRRAMVEPIKTDLELTDRSAANSDAHFSSDDDLMDELQSAVIQDAQPISVSKSPVSPVFPSPKKRNRFSRTFSSPTRKERVGSQHLIPPTKADPSRAVSASAAYLNRMSQQPAKPMVTKVNLGSGISQRIKALEKLSSLAPGATANSGVNAPSSGASPAFFSVRKASVRGSRSPSIAERANSLNRNSPSPCESPKSSPETFKLRERSSSSKGRVDTFTVQPVPMNKPQNSRPESISVTARIIRDPNQPFPTKSELGKDPSQYAPLDLKQSPLVIDHQRAIPTHTKETVQDRRLSISSRTSKTTTSQERRSSFTVVKDLIHQGRSSISERRRSITIEPTVSSASVLSPTRPPSTHANGSPSNRSALSLSSRRSSRDAAGGSFSPPPTARSSSSASDEREKKANRASRMLRRMSSSISSSRKNIAHALSPTVREESEPFSSASRDSSHPSLSATVAIASVNIGDVNVQFPDTLLWKRRSMLLDSQGYLIVSPALTAHGNDKDKANAGAVRRYHLSAFRTPAIPDVETQELPNSVVLDFLEGGGLQVACEDRGGQGRVLSSKFSLYLAA